MKPKLVIAVVVLGIALGAIAFALRHPDQPLELQVRESAPAVNPARMPAPAPTLVAPPPAPPLGATVVAAGAQKIGTVGSLTLSNSLPVATAPKNGDGTVAIQDGKTYDFSSGAAQVRASDKDKQAIDAALREIDAATAGLSIPPTAK